MARVEGDVAPSGPGQTAGDPPALFVFYDEQGHELLPRPLSRHVPLHVAVREPLFHRLGTSWEAFEGLRFSVAGMPPVSFRGDDLRAGDGPLPCPPVHVSGCPGGAFAVGVVASILGFPLHMPLGKHLPAPPLSASTCPVTVTLIGQPLQVRPQDVLVREFYTQQQTLRFAPTAVPAAHELMQAIHRTLHPLYDSLMARHGQEWKRMEDTEAVRAGAPLVARCAFSGYRILGQFFLHRTVNTWDDGRLGLLHGEGEGEEAGPTPPAVTVMCEPIDLEAEQRAREDMYPAYPLEIARIREEVAAAFAEWQVEAQRGQWELEVEWIQLFREKQPPTRPSSSSSSSSGTGGGGGAPAPPPPPAGWHAHELLPLLMVARRLHLPTSLTRAVAGYLTVIGASRLRGKRVGGRTRTIVEAGQDCPPPPPDRDYEFYQQYFRQHRRQPRITIVFEPSSAVPRGALLSVHAPMLDTMALGEGCLWPCQMSGSYSEHGKGMWYVVAGEPTVQRRDFVGKW